MRRASRVNERIDSCEIAWDIDRRIREPRSNRGTHVRNVSARERERETERGRGRGWGRGRKPYPGFLRSTRPQLTLTARYDIRLSTVRTMSQAAVAALAFEIPSLASEWRRVYVLILLLPSGFRASFFNRQNLSRARGGGVRDRAVRIASEAVAVPFALKSFQVSGISYSFKHFGTHHPRRPGGLPSCCMWKRNVDRLAVVTRTRPPPRSLIASLL